MFQKIIKSAQLISLPDIYIKLKNLMDEPDYSMADVAILVGSDPAMATRFLRLVNSPFNRRVHKIETVSHAVSMLGIQQIHDIVLSASVAKAFDGIQKQQMNMKKYWQRSFYCAVTAKQLALDCGINNSDRFFTMGLLHDIGHMIMYQAVPEESQQALMKSIKLAQPLYKAERELIGFDYAKLGAYLMKLWNLPQNFQVITCFHPEPHKTGQYAMETSLLHLSCLLVLSDLQNGVFGEGSFKVDPAALQTSHLTQEQCLACRELASDQFNQVESTLFM